MNEGHGYVLIIYNASPCPETSGDLNYDNVVDILESKHVEPYKYMNAHIFKLPWVDKVKDKING